MMKMDTEDFHVNDRGRIHGRLAKSSSTPVGCPGSRPTQEANLACFGPVGSGQAARRLLLEMS